ncbi:MAG: (Fe-S)-binding protein [Promethearchaeota archaeon]
MELYKYLPKTNCKECGKPTCMAFALDLLQGKVKVDDCTPLLETKYKTQYEALKELLGAEEGKEKELKINVDTDLCDGCGICVTVCPVNARYCPSTLSGKAPEYPPEKHQLFQVKGGKCELLNLEQCRRLEAEGRERECRVCETYCPREAVKIEYV